ncbi:MAG: aldo/keto reductase [Anaerolineae bacterium]|nr:aldo/keto reductase [Anaerolineae bacterium]
MTKLTKPPLTINSTVTLNNGVKMPLLGLGVYQARGREGEQAVAWALEAGYRHIDTAKFYGNEAEVGRAVRESGLPREDIFIVTKLWNSDHGYDRARAAFQESQKRLNLGVVDLYLIHWPVSARCAESWRALEALYAEGQIRAIGVSNYTIKHLKELLATARVVPAVNQVEFHPWLYQKELLEFCRAHGIQLEAYSPLTKGERLRDPQLEAMARKYGKSPAQMLIRWCLQHEVVVIPKSTHPQRIHENAAIYDFEITAEDMCHLDAFDERYHCTWDPTGEP